MGTAVIDCIGRAAEKDSRKLEWLVKAAPLSRLEFPVSLLTILEKLYFRTDLVTRNYWNSRELRGKLVHFLFNPL
jgi:hypothetical protein